MEIVANKTLPTFTTYVGVNGDIDVGTFLTIEVAARQGKYWDALIDGVESPNKGIRGVIMFSGKARTGKNTFAEFVCEALEAKGYKVLTTAFADFLKSICAAHYGFTGEKKGEGRSILQEVGDVFRKNYEDIFVDIVKSLVYGSFGEYDYVLITDLRFLNEAGKIKTTFGDIVRTVRIERPDLETDLTGEQQKHASETQMDTYKFEDIIQNVGTEEELKRKAVEYVEKILENPFGSV